MENSEAIPTTPNWKSAKSAFDEGRLQDALNQFISLVPENPRDTALYFNIGNIEFRLGNYGRAVAFLEKANRLSPESSEVLKARNIAERAYFSQQGPRDLDPGAQWYDSLDQAFNLSYLGAFLALAAAVTLAFERIRKDLRPLLWVSTGLFVLSGLTLGLNQIVHREVSAVCKEPSIVRSGPGDSYLELSRVDAGIRLRDLKLIDSSDWAQVRYSKDARGWIRKSAILLLD